jgi:hypothetical protein
MNTEMITASEKAKEDLEIENESTKQQFINGIQKIAFQNGKMLIGKFLDLCKNLPYIG